MFDRAVDEEGLELAVRLEGGERWIVVGQELESRHFVERVQVGSSSLTLHGPFWVDAVPGRGSAAIAEDGRVVVAMDDGHLLVFAAEGDPVTHEGVRIVDVELGESIRFVSAIGSEAVVLIAQNSKGTEQGRGTGIRWLNERGGVSWRAEVSFSARQPPIDGGHGLVYVAGDGLAAVRGGAVLWSSASTTPTTATAFADGTLAVCVGPQLRVVDRDGRIRQQLTTPDLTPIVTPPAIGPDGAVWVATERTLYVAR